MRVLVSGGVKTKGLSNEIAKAFEIGTVEFTQENNLDKLKDFIARGDYFDRAIVMEQSWTYDGSSTSESELRNRLSDFTELALSKFDSCEFVFVTTTIEKAKMISEETLLIGNRLVVIVKGAPYTRGTFKPMVKESINELKNTLGFNYETQIAKEEAERNKNKANEFDSDLGWDDTITDTVDSASDIGLSEEDLAKKFDTVIDEDTDIKITNNLEEELEDEDDFMDRFCNTSFEDSDSDITNNFEKTSFESDEEEFNPLNTESDLFDSAEDDSIFGNIQPDTADEFGSIEENTEFSGFGEEAIDNGFSNFGDSTEDFGDFSESEDTDLDNFEDNTEDFGDSDFGDFSETTDNSFGNNDFGDFGESNDSDFGEDNSDFGEDTNNEFGDSDFGDFGDENSDFGDFGDFETETNNGLDTNTENFGDFGNKDTNLDEQEEFKGFMDSDTSSFNVGIIDHKESTTIKANLDKKEKTYATSDNSSLFDEPIEETNPFGENLDSDSFGTISNQSSLTETINQQELFGITNETSEETNAISDLFIEEPNSNQLEKASETVIQNNRNRLFGRKNNKVDNKEQKTQDNSVQNIETRGIFKGIKGKGMKKKKDFTYDLNNNAYNQDIELKNLLDTFRGRGSTLVVTGTSESGKSMIVGNMANMLNKMGYTVLIVDCDTVKRSQAYLNLDVYEAIHNIDAEINSLRLTVNSINAEIGRYAAIARQGLNILSTGLAADSEDIEKVISLNKLTNFIYAARASYNFVIFDVDFRKLVGPLNELVLSSDNIVITTKPTTKSIMELLINMSNIDDVSVREAMFVRGDIVFSHVTESIESICGYKVKDLRTILSVLDQMVINLIGGPGDYQFNRMRIAGSIQYSDEFDRFWMSKNYASDTQDGELIYMDILKSILLKR